MLGLYTLYMGGRCQPQKPWGPVPLFFTQEDEAQERKLPKVTATSMHTKDFYSSCCPEITVMARRDLHTPCLARGVSTLTSQFHILCQGRWFSRWRCSMCKPGGPSSILQTHLKGLHTLSFVLHQCAVESMCPLQPTQINKHG